MASPETPQVKEYLDETGLAYYHEKNTTAVKKEIKALGDKFEGELFTFETSLQMVETTAETNSSRIEAIESRKADKKQVTREALVDTIGIFNTESAGLAPMANDSNTIDVFQGATADSDGTTGLVPAPTAISGSTNKHIYFATTNTELSASQKNLTFDGDELPTDETCIIVVKFINGLNTHGLDVSFTFEGVGTYTLIVNTPLNNTNPFDYMVSKEGYAAFIKNGQKFYILAPYVTISEGSTGGSSGY